MPGPETSIQSLKGVGQQRAAAFQKLGIRRLGDLLSFFPRTYEDRSQALPITALLHGQAASVRAMVAEEPSLNRVRKGMELVKLRVVDNSGSLEVIFFNQSYVRTQLQRGQVYRFYGKVNVEGSRRSMTNPIFEPEEAPQNLIGKIVPIYSLSAGLSQKIMLSAIRTALDDCANQLPEALPAPVAEAAGLCQAPFAYENIHFPASFEALELARRRLVFEELFVLACALADIKNTRIQKSGVLISTPRMEDFFSKLPFVLTAAQKRAVLDCCRDLSSGRAMNRLVQGDVGSGKTVVAAACVWSAFEGGLQSAFMAPTEILVNQHYATLSALLSPFGVSIVKLTGSMTTKQKRESLAQIQDGRANLVIGTHALFSENVEFSNLALVVTDEQHRFGVNQRAALIAKGGSPHTLVMSATPIPRTLALIVYGDLDVSVIDELPPGRQKVDTFVVDENMRPRIYAFMEKQIQEGRQVFVVCPAVEEIEERPQALKSAVEHAMELQAKVFPRLRVGCVHGKMKAAEKDKVMQGFLEGSIHILVATTVIEVGVDVPNASLMVIENAERFGLSQLHQLRGRVGRGSHKSYCVLFSDTENELSRARLKVLESTTDGFKISEADLRLRGPGDFFGARQHGLPEMHIADLGMDMKLLTEAQEAAQALLKRDPGLHAPENLRLRQRIDSLFAAGSLTFN